MNKKFGAFGCLVFCLACLWIAASIGEVTAQNSIAIRPTYSSWNFFEIFWPA